MTCKGKCREEFLEKKLSSLISELRNATDENATHDYLLGLIIAIEILREE